MSKFLKYLIIILLFNTNTFLFSEEISIFPLPFVNTGSRDIDYLGNLIQNSLFTFLNKIENYSVVNPEVFNQYLNEKDEYNRKKMLGISKKLNIKYLIEGSYHEEEDYLIIDFKVIDTINNKTIYRSSKFGKGGIFSFETLDVLAVTMIEDFSNTSISSGKIKINTDNPCTLFVNNINMGTTPSTRLLPSGMHLIKLKYKNNNTDNIIFEKVIEIKKDDFIPLNVRVFVNYNITSEKKTNVYINNKKIGKTPQTGKLLTGQSYELKITYNPENSKSNEMIISSQNISTKDEKDINLDFKITGSIDFISKKDNLLVKLNNKINNIPDILTEIDPGKYNIKTYIQDKNKKYLFYSKKINLDAGECKIINFDDIIYKRKPGLIFLPSAAQFYNNQYIKASLFLTFFSVSVISAGLISPLASYMYYYFVYLAKFNAWNSKGYESGYTPSEIYADFDNVFYILAGSLSASAGIALIIWLISLIDGAVNINRLDKLFNPDKKRKFKLSFEVRIK